MRTALCTGLLFAALIPHSALADPFRINLAARQQEEDRLRAEELKRVDPNTYLNDHCEHASIKDQPLVSVLSDLSHEMHNRLLVDVGLLKKAGVDLARVTVNREGASVRAVLTDAMTMSGAAARGINFHVVNDLIVVSSAKRVNSLKLLLANAQSGATSRPARSPFAARLAVVALPICNESTQFGLTIGNVTLAEAVAEISQMAGVGIEADWESLKRAGIDGEADLRDIVDIPNVSVASALAVLFFSYEGFSSCRLHERQGKIVISADLK